MEIHAVFETWHIGDGNYPPFEKGILVNLSFQFEPDQLQPSPHSHIERFVHLGGAEYEFSGTVLRAYPTDSLPLVIVACGAFRF